MAALPTMLGCDSVVAREIVDERILAPLPEHDGPAKRRAPVAVVERDVHTLLDALRDAASPVAAVPPGFRGIADAAEAAKVRVVDVLSLVLGRRLSAVHRLADIDGVKGLLVDAHELRMAAARLLCDPAPTVAFRNLWLPVDTGWRLLDGAPGRPSLARRVVPASHGEHTFIRIPRAAIDAFRARYVTARLIGVEKNLSRDDIRKLMREHKVRYAARWHSVGVDLIERRHLPDVLAF